MLGIHIQRPVCPVRKNRPSGGRRRRNAQVEKDRTQSKQLLALVGLSVVLGIMIYDGHPETDIFDTLLIFGYAFVAFLVEISDWRVRGLWIARSVGVAVLGLGLAAFQFLPFLQYSGEGTRTAQLRANPSASVAGLLPDTAPLMAFPDLFGGPQFAYNDAKFNTRHKPQSNFAENEGNAVRAHGALLGSARSCCSMEAPPGIDCTVWRRNRTHRIHLLVHPVRRSRVAWTSILGSCWPESQPRYSALRHRRARRTGRGVGAEYRPQSRGSPENGCHRRCHVRCGECHRTSLGPRPATAYSRHPRLQNRRGFSGAPGAKQRPHRICHCGQRGRRVDCVSPHKASHGALRWGARRDRVGLRLQWPHHDVVQHDRKEGGLLSEDDRVRKSSNRWVPARRSSLEVASPLRPRISGSVSTTLAPMTPLDWSGTMRSTTEYSRCRHPRMSKCRRASPRRNCSGCNGWWEVRACCEGRGPRD